MPVFRFSGIPAAQSEEVRRTLRSPGYGHPAHRETARGYGQCRRCLQTFRVGEEDRLLFTYSPSRGEGALPQPGPVFIHADTCRRYDELAFPEALRPIPMLVEGYDAAGWLRVQLPVESGDVEAALARLFAGAQVAYAQLRNAEAGCFMARVERWHSCD